MAKTLDASAGGKARAKKLTPEERREIAIRAAEKRWGTSIPRATHAGVLRVGEFEIDCAVLEDGTRVLTQRGFLEALGRHPKANVRREGGEEGIPPILQGKSINPFISKEVLEKSRPVVFRTPAGSRASGYRADLLPKVCEVYLKARDAGVLPSNQKHVAKQADMLIRGLANVGIIALVDEATGYQADRARDALAKILEAFVAKELRKWVRTFPAEFYQELFRLRNITYNGKLGGKRPQYIGHDTNNLVYARLAPGVLGELRRRNPVTERGNRKHKHHQWLTEDLGHPKLQQHLAALTALMRASDTWAEFKEMLDRALPKTPRLPLFDGPGP